MEKQFLSLILGFLAFGQVVFGQDTIYVHRKVGGVYKELRANVDSITFSKPDPKVLAQWDFPIVNGTVNLKQTAGTLNLGAFSGFNAVLSADSGTAGVLATGTFWDSNDPGIGIILQYNNATAKDFSSVTSITYTVKVENPPMDSPGVMAYVQNGSDLNWAGDYSFWNPAPVAKFKTYTYVIDKTAANLDIAKIVSFRIKANGAMGSDSGTNCGKAGGSCARLRVVKVVMQ